MRREDKCSDKRKNPRSTPPEGVAVEDRLLDHKAGSSTGCGVPKQIRQVKTCGFISINPEIQPVGKIPCRQELPAVRRSEKQLIEFRPTSLSQETICEREVDFIVCERIVIEGWKI
jgi:hypothetical protein